MRFLAWRPDSKVWMVPTVRRSLHSFHGTRPAHLQGFSHRSTGSVSHRYRGDPPRISQFDPAIFGVSDCIRHQFPIDWVRRFHIH